MIRDVMEWNVFIWGVSRKEGKLNIGMRGGEGKCV